ncbi:hypothetical protein BGW80DRAFT_1292568, partial [Lactifluus volemus]
YYEHLSEPMAECLNVLLKESTMHNSPTLRPAREISQERLAITRAAVSALEDKVAGVRRNAISLIVRLMVTHPYGLMHSGLLEMEEWEDRYREMVKELQKTEKVLDDALSGNTGEADGDEAAESSTALPVKKRLR